LCQFILTRQIKGLCLAYAARTGAGGGNLKKIAGKVFLNDTRRPKKEKAPVWALFCFSRRARGAREKWAGA